MIKKGAAAVPAALVFDKSRQVLEVNFSEKTALQSFLSFPEMTSD